METKNETTKPDPAPSKLVLPVVNYDRMPTEEELARFDELDRRGSAGC